MSRIELFKDCWRSEMDVWPFIESLDDESVDILITDPPYPIELNVSGVVKSDRYGKKNEHYSVMTEAHLDRFFKEIFKKMKPNSALFLMTNRDNRAFFEQSIQEAGFTIKNELVWVKITKFADGIAMGSNFLNAFEYIIYAHKGKLGKVNTEFNAYVENSPDRGRNSKPEGLYAHMIRPLLKQMKNPLIIDPFAGSDPLTRALMRGLIHSCRTISNIKITGDKTDPAVQGKLLQTQSLRNWL